TRDFRGYRGPHRGSDDHDPHLRPGPPAMRLWFKTHRVLGWLLPLIGAAILAGMVGNERLPSLHITGMYLEGFPVQILSPALAATAVIGSLSTPVPRARITAARSIPAIETLYTLAMIAL